MRTKLDHRSARGTGVLRFLAAMVACLALVGGVNPSWGQTAAVPTGQGAAVSQVRVDVDRFGLGNVARQGDWVGVRLTLADTIDKPRNVVVRISSPDPDRDISVSERAMALNGQEKITVWLYHPLSFLSDGGDWVVTVYEAAEGSIRDAAGRELPALGELLARATVSSAMSSTGGANGPNSADVVRPGVGLMGVVGPNDFDLQTLSEQLSPTEAFMPYAHESTRLARGLLPAEFPDRWQGLAAFDVIVWGGGEPSELRPEARRAIREWIERGGHFVVVLPSAGQTWTNENLSDLYDAMPLVSVKKNEDEDLTEMKYMITHRSRTQVPTKSVVHTFAPLPDVGPSDAMSVLRDHKDRTIVVRRAVGGGAVTWIGLDLNVRQLEGIVESDVFWNRVLGRRGSSLSPSEVRVGPGGNPPLAAGRRPTPFDLRIPSEIALVRDSATGMLLAFIVFVLYWLVAGPLGFGVLKAKDLKKHAWLAFMLSGAVFTGVAWGGAFLLRRRDVEVRHFAILDHVFGQPVQRARMWASVLIPRYGDAQIRIGSPTSETRATNAVFAWDRYDGDPNISFPDAREYRTPIGDRTAISVPARQTIKQVQIDWAGAPPWAMPFPQSVPGATEAGSIRLLNGGAWQRDTPVLDGVLRHKLPGPLRNLQIVVITGQTPIRRWMQFAARRDDAIAEGFAFRYNAAWEPDTDLDLGVLTTIDTLPSLAKLLSDLRPEPGMSYDPADYLRQETLSDQMAALSLFHIMPPPQEDTQANYVYAGQRYYTHGMDLSHWLSHPCVMILGQLGDTGDGGVEAPIAMTVDGEVAPSNGITFVRWIYPLPSNPPRIATKPSPDQPERPAPNEQSTDENNDQQGPPQ